MRNAVDNKFIAINRKKFGYIGPTWCVMESSINKGTIATSNLQEVQKFTL